MFPQQAAARFLVLSVLVVSAQAPGPNKIRNLHLESISDTHVELHWSPTHHHTDDIVQYSVSLKRNELLGCQALGISTPPTVEIVQNVTNTSASVFGLHPFAEYTANIVAQTSMPGPPQAITFETHASHIPTSVVNNLRFDKVQNCLQWDGPVDCTTITGSIPGVRLFFDSVSVNAKNWTSRHVVSTYYDHYALDKIEMVPCESYRVRVHVIRHYTLPENRTHYQELILRTLPTVKSLSEQEPADECPTADTNPSSKGGSDDHQGEDQVDHTSRAVDESKEIFLPEKGPGKVQDLHFESVSDIHAELHWQSPVYRARDIVQYIVSLKMNKLLGCEDLQKPTPSMVEILRNVTNTSASFFGLHPYAEYTASVTAHTSLPGQSRAIIFHTNQSNIPTSVISNLRFDKNKNCLLWDEPVDCTTISGPTLGVRLSLAGVSDAVKNWTSQKDTYYDYFSLHKTKMVPGELYRIRVHVIRQYRHPVNRTQYQELILRTSPAAPTAVRLLEVYNLDADENSISLRWLPPVPPHGEIESYHVSIGTKNKVLKNPPISVSERGLMCRQWENYLCLENMRLPLNSTTDQMNVTVYAKNRDVTSLGAPARIVFDPESMRNTAPTEPLNLTAIVRPWGILSLEWAHPFISYTKLDLFWIRVDAIGTKSNGCQSPQFSRSIVLPVDQEKRKYSFRIKLPGSTTYRVSVAALDLNNSNSLDAQVEVSIPEIQPTFSAPDIKFV